LENNLLILLNFDDGTAQDRSTNGNNGTFQGGATTSVASIPLLHPDLSIRASQVELCWPSTPIHTYQLQYRSSLTTNEWVNLDGLIAGDGSRQCVTDSVPQNQPQRFYRLVITP